MANNLLKYYILAFLAMIAIVVSCKKDPFFVPGGGVTNQQGWVYSPTAVTIQFPPNFPSATFPADNPLTTQGVQLGRMLFYDPILSKDSTLACAGCHRQQYAFSDGGNAFSKGLGGYTTRNAPPLFNLVFNAKFFWDGRASSLENQIEDGPVTNPIEMASTWPDVVAKVQLSKIYPKLMYEAFGIEPDSIQPAYIAKAIAQFELTIVSDNSPFDQDEAGGFNLSASALTGATLIQTNQAADCGHCHGDYITNPTFMELDASQEFRNNGIDSPATYLGFKDPGRGGITKIPADYGEFKVPSLRNLGFTYPYMHDGRYTTLSQVINHYSDSVSQSVYTDPTLQPVARHGGVHLTAQQTSQVLAFLQSLNDSSLITNPAYSNPFK